MHELRDTLSACFRQRNTVDQTASALEQTVTKAINKLAADIEVYYSKASWYRILQQYVTAGYDHFRYIIEVTDSTCRTCLSQSQRTYTAGTIGFTTTVASELSLHNCARVR